VRWFSGLRCPLFPPLAFRLSMPLAGPRLGATLLLPLCSLPTPHRREALRLPTVPLVIPSCLKPPAALLPQTTPPPQPPTGRDASACRKMPLSHGRAYSLGAARGGLASSPGTPLSAHDSALPGRPAIVARSYGPLGQKAPSHGPTTALPSSPEWPMEAKETRKETAQIRAPLKETGLSKETARRSIPASQGNVTQALL
jgi:hypothetical protein